MGRLKLFIVRQKQQKVIILYHRFIVQWTRNRLDDFKNTYNRFIFCCSKQR